MSQEQAVIDFARQGVTLWRDGDALRYRTRKGAMTPSVRAVLDSRRDALLPYLPTAAPPIIKGRKLTPELWRDWQQWVAHELERLKTETNEDREPILNPETGEPLTDPFADENEWEESENCS